MTVLSCETLVSATWLVEVGRPLKELPNWGPNQIFCNVFYNKLSLFAGHFQTDWSRAFRLVSNQRELVVDYSSAQEFYDF